MEYSAFYLDKITVITNVCLWAQFYSTGTILLICYKNNMKEYEPRTTVPMQLVEFSIPYKKEGYFSMRLKGIFVSHRNTPRTKKIQICYKNILEDSCKKVSKR